MLPDTVASMRSGLRPFSAYLLDTFGVSLRRLPQVMVISLVGWAPAAAVLWLLLGRAVHLPSVEEALAMVDAGPSRIPTQLVIDPRLAVELGLAFAVCYLLGQAIVSGACTHQMYHSSTGYPTSSLRSLGRSFARLHRTLPALLFMVTLFCIPFVAGAGFAGWMMWMDGTEWQEPARKGAAIFGLTFLLVLWAWGRLSLWPAAAVLAPRWTFSARISLKATGRRWWQVVLRLLAVSLLTAAVVSAVSTPLALMGLQGSAALVAAAFTARVMLSLVAASFSSSAAALVYADTDAPAALE